MKLLHLLPYIPTPPTFGGSIRMYHILKHLCEHHDVTVAGYAENGNLDTFYAEFPKLENDALFIKRHYLKFHRLLQAYSLFTSHSHWYNWSQSKKFEQQLNHLLASEPFDIVLSEFASMGHFNLKTDALRILDAHNVEYDNFKRMSQLNWSPVRKLFYTREYKKLAEEEVDIFRKQDAIFATSQRDSDLIGKDVPAVRRYVVPNGVDTDFFSSKGSNPEPWSLVFTGAMHYVPNTDGMITFLENIFPLIQNRIPQATVTIVGSNPPSRLTRFQSSSVKITGFVDDVRPYIEQASVYIVPLYMGGGTRLKVVEALAMQKPIVSTSIGSEGIEVNDGEHLLIRDDHEEFANAVIELLLNPNSGEELVRNGYQRVQERYDWRVVGQTIERALVELYEQKNRKPLSQTTEPDHSAGLIYS